MSAVWRLVLTYFTRTPGLRWFSGAGFVTFGVACVFSQNLAGNVVALIFVFVAPWAIVLGAGIMPGMVTHLARSHAITVLPYGRVKLLASAIITIALVALPFPVLNTLAQWAAVSPETRATIPTWDVIRFAFVLTGQVWPVAMLVASWLYFTLWFITRIGNLGGVIGTMIGLLATIYAPQLRIANLDPLVTLSLIQLAITWAVFALLVFHAPRLRMEGGLKSLWQRLPVSSGSRVSAGHELALMLGTSRPGVFAAAIGVPMAVQFAAGLEFPSRWLFYLTLASCVCGALACRAAIRARAVWLRTRWKREELFAHVEWAFWKHNALVLALLLVLLVAFVEYYGLERRFILFGVPLLALGTAVSTYMGLMMTRGMRWFDSTLAIAVMAGVMSVAVLVIFREAAVAKIVAAEVALGVTTIVLRFEARRRWAHLDWMLCRPEIGAETRTFS